MDLHPLPLRRIAVMTYHSNAASRAQVQDIVEFLRQSGVPEISNGVIHDHNLEERIRAGEFDLLLALGGDGTMLHAGHLCANLGTPILGINLGRFGFLAEIRRGEWREGLASLMAGRYRIEERMLLHAEQRRGARKLADWLVVNEVVVCRGQFVRPIRVRASVDGTTLTTYVADGVIVSSATGSTAYALAAGGPILPPEMRNMLLIPVAPHLTMDRAIVLTEGACVEMAVLTDHEAVMSVDGLPPVPLLDGDVVAVGASDKGVRFVRFQDPGYFYRNITAYMEQNPSVGARA
jgi:NAD+ kinase